MLSVLKIIIFQELVVETIETNSLSCPCKGELRLSGNHTVKEYEMSGKPYSQKSELENHTNERIFQVMPRFDQFMTR